MARLYSDENFRFRVVELLRSRGHYVLTTVDAGQAGYGIPDSEVLEYAVSLGRAVLTFDRRDYLILHNQRPGHEGIIVCSEDHDDVRLADGIETAIASVAGLRGQLLRVNLPHR